MYKAVCEVNSEGGQKAGPLCVSHYYLQCEQIPDMNGIPCSSTVWSEGKKEREREGVEQNQNRTTEVKTALV